jgi:hypothetical protein
MKFYLFGFFMSLGFFAMGQDTQPVIAPDAAVAAEGIVDAAKTDYVMCKNGEVVRTVRIEKNKGICQTTYTKEGVGTTVGKSAAQSVCRKVLGRIRENLEKANWKCKDITQSRVSSSIE